MKTKIYYSVRNGGDGSAYPTFMESKELCELDQKFMPEGWGEPCIGYLEIEHEGPIKVKLETVDDVIKELEETIKFTSDKEWGERYRGNLEEVKQLKERQGGKDNPS